VATAYEAAVPLKWVLISSGQAGWKTLNGLFKIEGRVAKETIDGRSLIGQCPTGRGTG
jgi:hypothetical protein